MADLHDPTRDALSAAVTALVRRHGGPTAVSRAISVDRTRVHAWMKGDIGIDRLGQLAYELGEPITVRFGPKTEKEAAPSMTRRLEIGIRALERKAGVTPEELVLAEAALEADARLAAALGESQRKSDEQAGGRAGGQSAASLGSKRQKP